MPDNGSTLRYAADFYERHNDHDDKEQFKIRAPYRRGDVLVDDPVKRPLRS